MRDLRPSSLTWSIPGWLLPLAFLALPDCSWPGNPIEHNLIAGGKPRNWAVFCDIPKKDEPPRCATPDEVMQETALTHAAVSLTKGTGMNIGLDYSPQARMSLGCGDQPVAITFEGAFPAGLPVCVNALDVLGTPSAYGTYPSANALCVAACEDLFGTIVDSAGTFRPTVPPTPDVRAFCQQNARVSTSYPVEGQALVDFIDYFAACDAAGKIRSGFEDPTEPFSDPRRRAEPVPWRYATTGVERGGPDANTLTRTAPTTGQFDQGAASLHLISTGDGQVDVTVVETNTTRAFGLSTGILSDHDPTLADIDFGVVLEPGNMPGGPGNLLIYEGGNQIGTSAFATCAPGDRVRIKFLDNFDGTASIAYFVVPASCQGPLCEGDILRLSGPLAYPLHVDASLLTQGATLGEARMVRIKKWHF